LAKITEEMKKVLDECPIWVLSTASKDGMPNAIPIRFHSVLDDGKMVFVDNFMKQTLVNLQENPKVAVTAWVNLDGYQFKGTAAYQTSGPVYDAGRSKAKEVNAMLPAKGVLVVTIDEIYCQTPGPKAGLQVE